MQTLYEYNIFDTDGILIHSKKTSTITAQKACDDTKEIATEREPRC